MPVLRSRTVDSPSRHKPPMAPSTPSPSSRRRSLRLSGEEPPASPLDNPDKRRRMSLDDKAKAPLISADSSSDDDDGDRDGDGDQAVEAPVLNETVPAVTDRRARDRALALEAAPRFALFKTEEAEEEEEEEEEEAGDEDDVDDGDDDRDGGDWPGPFSTAMKLIKEREERLKARQEERQGDSKADGEIEWRPTRKEGLILRAPPPSLKGLALKVLAANAAHIESLAGVPGFLVKQICSAVCGSRTMTPGLLSGLVSGEPTEIYVPDCSWITEEVFETTFSGCNTQCLQVLELGLSGRCLPDYVLSSTLARAPNCMPALSSVSFAGNYRLSDDGLVTLACAAPTLSSINLNKCSLSTSAGITKLLDTLKGSIKKLVLDDCQSISGTEILPTLKKLKKLQVISVARLQDVNNKFVTGLASSCLCLEELGLAGCIKVSAKSTKVIGGKCRSLCKIDLRNIQKLNDQAIAYLASGCPSFRKLLLQRNNCSDEAIAAFLEASGNSLLELSLNNLKVSRHTAVAISRRCSSTLEKLDLSFSRMMSDEALGLIVDSCTKLKVLKLFGCTQVTDVFLNGHSNTSVQIIGIGGSILNHLEVPDILSDW